MCWINRGVIILCVARIAVPMYAFTLSDELFPVGLCAELQLCGILCSVHKF